MAEASSSLLARSCSAEYRSTSDGRCWPVEGWAEVSKSPRSWTEGEGGDVPPKSSLPCMSQRSGSMDWASPSSTATPEDAPMAASPACCAGLGPVASLTGGEPTRASFLLDLGLGTGTGGGVAAALLCPALEAGTGGVVVAAGAGTGVKVVTTRCTPSGCS